MLDDYEAEARQRSIQLEALGKLPGPRGISSSKPLERHAAKEISKIRFGPWDNGPWGLDELPPFTDEQLAGFETAYRKLQRERPNRPSETKPHDPVPATPTVTDLRHPLTQTELVELKRLKHALAAAPNADTFAALAKGEAVHPSHLNPEHRRSL